MADAWKLAGYNRPGGENAARLVTTQAYANSLAAGQALPRACRLLGAARWALPPCRAASG